MALTFESWWSGLWLGLAGALLVYYLNFRFFGSKYWKRRNIFHLPPVFILGNTWRSGFADHFSFILAGFYRKYKDRKLVGFWNFTKPGLLVTDLEIVKNILTRDFNYFRDRRRNLSKHDPLSDHLFNLEGSKWRKLRVKLSPTFTSGKMKMMFWVMVKCGEELGKYLEEASAGREELEVKEVLGRFTTDVISSCGFGIEANSLRNPNSEFHKYGKKIFAPSWIFHAKRIFINLSPFLFNLFKLTFTPKDISDFFINTVRDTMEYREKNKVKRNDFMDLLIQLKNHGKLEDVDGGSDKDVKFSFNEVATQVFMFFLAGFESSSTTMTFALYELALNTDIQRVLQKEIDDVVAKYGGDMTYDAVMEMEYLDWVFQETLRKHSPALLLFRECSKDYVIPELGVTIPEKTPVIIPLFGIQRDPEHYPDPDKFDPERFSPAKKAERHHFSFLPFGEGPRNCIGSRFGSLMSKIGIVSVLSKFNVEPAKETPIPMVYDKKSFVLSSASSITLRFVPRA